MESTTTAQWSSLPRDLLTLIASRLDSKLDLLRLRGVCSKWRSSLPLRSPPSLRLPFPIGPNPRLNPLRRGYFTLHHRPIYFLQPLTHSAHTWALKLDHTRTSQMVGLWDPLSRIRFHTLPKHCPRSLNLLDYRVGEVGDGAYALDFVELGKIPEFDFNELKSVRPRKVLAFDGNGTHPFAVLAIHTGAKLGLWKMGDSNWVCMGPGASRYEDIAYLNNKFYAVEHTGLTIAIEIDSSHVKVTQVAPPFRRRGYNLYGGHVKHLVKSRGGLFLVDRYQTDTYGCIDVEDLDWSSDCEDASPIQMVVHKLDQEKKEWTPVDTIGDQVFFLGDDCTFSVSAKDFPGCKPNSIYFTDVGIFTGDGDDDRPGFDACIYNLDDDVFGPMYSFPSYSKLFWPPPTWLNLPSQ